MHDAECEDCADSDASKLDWWVFDKVKPFLSHAKTDEPLAKPVWLKTRLCFSSIFSE